MNLSRNFDRARTESASAYRHAMTKRKWRVRRQKANAIWKNTKQLASDNATVVFLTLAVFILSLAMAGTSILIVYLWNSNKHQDASVGKTAVPLEATAIQQPVTIESPQLSVMDRSEQIELRFSNTLSQPQPKEK